MKIKLLRPFARAMAWARYAEPAKLKADWVIAVGVIGALGLTVPGVIDRWVGAGITAFAIVAPYLQGQVTRKDVWSQRTVDDLTALVQLFPGDAEEIKQKIAAGLEYRIIREHLEAKSAPRHATVAG